jgi:hypothetical protein
MEICSDVSVPVTELMKGGQRPMGANPVMAGEPVQDKT